MSGAPKTSVGRDGIIHSGSGSMTIGSVNFAGEEISEAKFFRKLQATDPRLDKRRIERVKGGLLKQCCEWILYHQQFIQWRDGKGSQLLWIRGDPGKGKTMLMCGIIDHMSVPGITSSTASMAFAFCEASDGRATMAQSVVASLVYQLLQQNKTAKKRVLARYRDSGDDVFDEPNGWDALCDILDDVLQADGRSISWLFIDALDECTQGLEDLLELLTNLLRHDVRIVVSSRNRPDIENGLRHSRLQNSLRLELNKGAISKAVTSYIGVKVDQLANQKHLDGLERQEVYEYLQSNANDTFLWVSLVYQETRNISISRWDVLNYLKKFPPTLERIYQRMGTIISEYEKPRQRRLQHLLALTALAYRPLQLKELSTSIPEHVSSRVAEDLGFWRHEVESCGSLLAIEKNKIFFVHQTSKDFVQRHFGTTIIPDSAGAAHERIAKKALKALSTSLRKDVYDLKAPGTHIDNVRVPRDDPLLGIKYVCVHWAEHFTDAVRHFGAATSPSVYEDIKNFLSSHFLHLIEALCLLKALPSLIISLSQLVLAVEKSCVGQQRNEQSELLSLLETALRALRYFYPGIQSYPVQIYVCAPVFTPSPGLSEGLIPLQQPPWMASLPMASEGWGACLQTVATYDMLCSSVSSAGSQMVCGAYHLRVWDTSASRLLHSYNLKIETHQVALSAIDGFLAFRSRDGEVYICDMVTKKHLSIASGVLVTPGDSAPFEVKLAFSSDGRRLVIARSSTSEIISWTSEGATLDNWAMASRESRSLGSHTAVLALSPNAELAAISTGEQPPGITIWDLVTGFSQTTIAYEGNYAAFSADSAIFAAFCGSVVRVWDLRSDIVVAKHSVDVGRRSHMSPPVLAVSTDGEHLAIATDTRTFAHRHVAYYSYAGGSFEEIEGCGSTAALHFAAEGKTLITVAGGGFQIWDTKSLLEDQGSTRLRHSTPCAISWDYKYLVDDARRVSLRDATTGECLRFLKGSNTLRGPVSFGHDGVSPMMVAIDSLDRNYVRVWNMATGSLQGRFDFKDNLGIGNKHFVDKRDRFVGRKVSVSPDGRYIGAFLGPQVQLWCRIAGWPLSEWEAIPLPPRPDGSNIPAMTFGPTGLLAILSEKGTAEIWDGNSFRRLQLTPEEEEFSMDSLGPCIAFSPCGKHVAAGYRRRHGDRFPLPFVEIWNVDSGLSEIKMAYPGKRLPIAFSWPNPDGSSFGTAVFRENFNQYEIATSIEPRGMDLRYFETNPEWIYLKDEPVLWLPPDWRAIRSLGGWAGPMVPLQDLTGRHYKCIELSQKYLQGGLTDWMSEIEKIRQNVWAGRRPWSTSTWV